MGYKPWRTARPPRAIELYGDYTRDLHSGRVGYNFTIRVKEGSPPLSEIRENAPEPILTPLGKTVFEQVHNAFPAEIWVRSAVFMPDYIHLFLWVKTPLKLTILQILAKSLLFSEKHAREAHGIETLWQRPGHLFQCYSLEVLQQKIAYNRGNVLRWKMDHNHRMLSHPHLVSHPKLSPAYNWEGYGELGLLDCEHFLPCYISSATSDDAVAHFTRLAIKLATAGWVLVGGFVSERERALLTAVRAATSPCVIHLSATRLKDEKVPAKLAEALYTGRFLRLTSAEGATICTRELCVWHNLWAETFCGDWRAEVKAHFNADHALTEAQVSYIHRFLTQWPSPRASKYHGPRPLP